MSSLHVQISENRPDRVERMRDDGGNGREPVGPAVRLWVREKLSNDTNMLQNEFEVPAHNTVLERRGAECGAVSEPLQSVGDGGGNLVSSQRGE